jgi:glycosyltransferase
MYDAMNKGILMASCEIIGILNSDDQYFSKNVINRILDEFSYDNIDACYGDLVYVDSSGKNIVRYWKSGHFNGPKQFLLGWMPPHPTFFVRKRVYDQYGMFNLDLGSSADYELMLRLMVKHEIRVSYIPEMLIKMRIGGMSNSSFKNRIKANQMDRKAWRVNELSPHPWTLWLKPLRKLPQYWRRPESIYPTNSIPKN